MKAKRASTSVIASATALALVNLVACSGDSDAPDDDAVAASGGAGGSTAGKGSGGSSGAKGGSSGTNSAGSTGTSGSAGGVGKGGSGGVSSGGAGGAGTTAGGTPSTAGNAGSATAGAGGTSGGASGSAGTGAGGSGGDAIGGTGQGGMSGEGSGGSNAGSAGIAGGGTSGASGSSGSAGSGSCPTALVGWATVSGDGVSNTTGGGNATPVRPTSADQLLDYASDETARVIEIQGSFNIPRLRVASNKTLVGIGNNATINGGIQVRGDDSEPVSNVIIRNLRVNGATTEFDDAVQIYFAHHVWIDHVEIYDGPDGNLDMTHAVNWVTVSWSKFRYTTAYMRPEGESSDHRFSSLIGHSDDNAEEDTGRLKITFHHNWWAERVIERMPRVRFGQVHVFNNYYSSADSNYCIRAGYGAQLLVEGNYFDGVSSPHQFNSDDDRATASITARNNEYDQTSGDQLTGGDGPTFTSVPYSATVEAATSIPSIVQACAGPR